MALPASDDWNTWNAGEMQVAVEPRRAGRSGSNGTVPQGDRRGRDVRGSGRAGLRRPGRRDARRLFTAPEGVVDLAGLSRHGTGGPGGGSLRPVPRPEDVGHADGPTAAAATGLASHRGGYVHSVPGGRCASPRTRRWSARRSWDVAGFPFPRPPARLGELAARHQRRHRVAAFDRRLVDPPG